MKIITPRGYRFDVDHDTTVEDIYRTLQQYQFRLRKHQLDNYQVFQCIQYITSLFKGDNLVHGNVFGLVHFFEDNLTNPHLCQYRRNVLTETWNYLTYGAERSLPITVYRAVLQHEDQQPHPETALKGVFRSVSEQIGPSLDPIYVPYLNEKGNEFGLIKFQIEEDPSLKNDWVYRWATQKDGLDEVLSTLLFFTEPVESVAT